MAEIIEEPSALSKIIPVSFKINDTDSVTTTRLATKKQFNTTDTDAWLSFTLEGIDASLAGEYDLTMINVDENPSSIVNHTNIAFSGIPFHYKMDSSADLTKNEIRHAGRWMGQVVVRLTNGDTTTRQFDFAITGHLMDGKEARLILIEDYNALMATITTSKDELAQYNIDYAALIETVTTQEAARVQAELTRAQTFDALVESEMVAQNVATKLTEKEATFAPRMLSVEQQLEQAATKAELSAVASPLVASLAAQMTDTTRVYVYTGAEGGYVTGNWYYHNGTAWVSGGVYQATGIADDSVTVSQLKTATIQSLADTAQAQVALQYDKPTYGVDSMTFYQRRDRMPIVALNYFSAKIVGAQAHTDIDGYPAFTANIADGATFAIDIPLTATITEDFNSVMFDYFAVDSNLSTLRIDLVVDDLNLYRYYITPTHILTQGLNHIILDKSERGVVGAPTLAGITKVRVRGTVKVGSGLHTFKLGDVHMYSYKPTVTIWFDDQLKSVYTVAKPIMDAYAFKGVQAVIGERVGVSSSYQNNTELAQMKAEGWEHTNHTYKHEKFGTVTAEKARLSIQRGMDFCLSKGYGKPSYYLVNPGSQTTVDSFPFEKQYSTLRRIGVGYNQFPIVDMYNITSKEPMWADSVATVKSWVDKSVLDGTWLIFLFHGIQPLSNGAAASFWPTEYYQELMDYLFTLQEAGSLRVKTCSETLSLM